MVKQLSLRHGHSALPLVHYPRYRYPATPRDTLPFPAIPCHTPLCPALFL